MRILADENIEHAMIEWLLAQGCDVALSRDRLPGESDVTLLGEAIAAGRIVLTRDKDFGELATKSGGPLPGVILLRMKAPNQLRRLELFKSWWEAIQAAAPGALVVVGNDGLRARRLT